jgi:hypothetical protein
MPLASYSTIRRPQPQVAGQRDDLVADALHQAAVADQGVGVVVDDVVAELGVEHGLGHGHAGRVGDALAQRPGGRLDAVIRFVFRMPWRVRAEFAEALDLLDRKRLVARQMQQRVDQGRTVAVGLHEAVAVRPARIGGVELQVPGEQRRADVGRTQRRAGVAVADAGDRVHGQEADRAGQFAGGGCHGAAPSVA